MTSKTALAILAAGLAASACVTTSVKGMREHKPVLVEDTPQSVATLTDCISAAWIAKGMTPRQIPRANGATLLVEMTVGYALPVILVDMDTTALGTHVEMRLFKSISSKQNRQRVEEVRGCLTPKVDAA